MYPMYIMYMNSYRKQNGNLSEMDTCRLAAEEHKVSSVRQPRHTQSNIDENLLSLVDGEFIVKDAISPNVNRRRAS